MSNQILPVREHQKGSLQVAAIYCFTNFKEEVINKLLSNLIELASSNKVKGTLLLAKEGINGTICGPKEGVQLMILMIKQFTLSASLEIKLSWSKTQIFRRLKIKEKGEIVTMGINGIDPLQVVGTYVDAHKWNVLIEDEKTLVIDTRNKYEIAIGSFKGSINPETDTFREFPEWVHQKLIPLIEEKKPKNIAMFCTGGIRCEKATSYLKNKGIKGVHHLKGGILRYLEHIKEEDSLWEGECFVFDRRVALNHQLHPGIHKACYACGLPLKPEDLSKKSYIRGIQCHQCVDKFSDRDRARFAERQRQLEQRKINKKDAN